MEGSVFDVFRVLSLVVTWAIPAILVLAVVVFAIAAPALTLAGAVLRLYEAVRDKIQRRAPAETQLPVEMHAVQEIGAACDDRTKEVAQKHAAEKELVEMKA